MNDQIRDPEDFDSDYWDRPLAEVLGIKIEYAPEDLAPPIDLERLRLFDSDEMVGDERHEIITLIGTFKSWHDAWVAVHRESVDEPSG